MLLLLDVPVLLLFVACVILCSILLLMSTLAALNVASERQLCRLEHLEGDRV